MPALHITSVQDQAQNKLSVCHLARIRCGTSDATTRSSSSSVRACAHSSHPLVTLVYSTRTARRVVKSARATELQATDSDRSEQATSRFSYLLCSMAVAVSHTPLCLTTYILSIPPRCTVFAHSSPRLVSSTDVYSGSSSRSLSTTTFPHRIATAIASLKAHPSSHLNLPRLLPLLLVRDYPPPPRVQRSLVGLEVLTMLALALLFAAGAHAASLSQRPPPSESKSWPIDRSPEGGKGRKGTMPGKKHAIQAVLTAAAVSLGRVGGRQRRGKLARKI